MAYFGADDVQKSIDETPFRFVWIVKEKHCVKKEERLIGFNNGSDHTMKEFKPVKSKGIFLFSLLYWKYFMHCRRKYTTF